MVLAEHDWAWEEDESADLAKRHAFPVIRAMEINTEDGHILVFGMHEYKFGMHRSHELAGFVEEVDGVMIAAHPYRRQMPWKPDDEGEYADALDRATRNPAYRFVSASRGAQRSWDARRERLLAPRWRNSSCTCPRPAPATPTSTTRKTSKLGRAATYFEVDIANEADLIAALKSGRFWPLDLTKGKLTTDPHLLRRARRTSRRAGRRWPRRDARWSKELPVAIAGATGPRTRSGLPSQDRRERLDRSASRVDIDTESGPTAIVSPGRAAARHNTSVRDGISLMTRR